MTTPDEVKRLADEAKAWANAFANAHAAKTPDPQWGVDVSRAKLALLAAIDALAAQAAQPVALPEPVLQALRFYAHGEHYSIDRDRFDTVSGEPQNWLCSVVDDDSTMIEDGTIARAALRGESIDWIDGGDDEQPKPVAGEVFSAASPQAAQPSSEPAKPSGVTQ